MNPMLNFSLSLTSTHIRNLVILCESGSTLTFDRRFYDNIVINNVL